MFIRLVQENTLENMLFVRHRCFIGVVVHAELMLVIAAIERHFDFPGVLGVGVRVVHWAEARGLAAGAVLLILSEADLVFLLFGLGFRTQIVGEVRSVIL